MTISKFSQTIRSFGMGLTCLVFLIMSPAAQGGHFVATWVDIDTFGLWSESDNWDIGVVPLNGSDTFDVIIPSGFTVEFDVDTAGFVTDLTLATGSKLKITPGHSLTVLDDAQINGVVEASGTSTDFVSNSFGAVLGSGAQVIVSGGAGVDIGTADYDSKSLNDNATLFSTNGAGSRIDLSKLQTFDARFPSTYKTHTVSAANYGVIDMSWLGTLYGAAHGTSRLDFHMDSQGYINLYSLIDILDGYTRFDVDIDYYSLPSLETARGVTFDAAGGVTIDLPTLEAFDLGTFIIAEGGTIIATAMTDFTRSQVDLTPGKGFVTGGLSNFDNSRINLSDGAQFGVEYGDINAVSYSTTGLNGSYTILSAHGESSRLDLSSLVSLDGRHPHSYKTHTVSAADSGVIDLSSVSSLYGATNSTSSLRFQVASNGAINLSSLVDIPSGHVNFDIDVPVFELPLLESAVTTTFDAGNGTTIDLPVLGSLTNGAIVIGEGGAVNAPGLVSFVGSRVDLTPGRSFSPGSLSDIDKSRITLSDGAIFGVSYGNLSADSYSAVGLNGNYTLFSAGGTGTQLDLSSLLSFDGRHPHSYNTNTVSVMDKGKIDLSGVSVVYGAVNGTSALKFTLAGDGTIDLSSLLEIPSGYTVFDVDVPGFTLGTLKTAVTTTFDASHVTTIDVPELTSLTSGRVILADGGIFNALKLTRFTGSWVELTPDRSFNTAALSEIDNARILLADGVKFGTGLGDVNAKSYSSVGLNGNYTLFSADGFGTQLDLSSLLSFDGSHPHSYKTHTVSATNQAVLDFSGIGIIHGAVNGTSRLHLSVDSGGTMVFGGDLNVTRNTQLTVNGLDSTLVIGGDLSLDSPGRLTVTEGAAIKLGGDFVHSLTDEAVFNVNAGVIQIDANDVSAFEVAGEDLGLGGATSGNFGIGQLVVGSEVTPTTVMLTDLVDNGNRNEGGEALYLYGAGGMSGLRIGPGGRLIIGNVNVYAYVGSEMIHINELFGPGVKWIPFDQGKITLTDYDCSLKADLNGDCFVNLIDLGILASEWLECGDLECE